VVIKGARGALLAGCRVAARLGAWEYKRSSDRDGSFAVSAKLSDRDPFWLNYRPLYLELGVGNRRVKWEVVNVHETKTKITIEARGTWGGSLSVLKASG